MLPVVTQLEAVEEPGAEDCALIRAGNIPPIIGAMGRGDGEGDRPTDEYSPLTMAVYGSYGYGPNQQQQRYRFVTYTRPYPPNYY